jgi:hypothetical protein
MVRCLAATLILGGLVSSSACGGESHNAQSGRPKVSSAGTETAGAVGSAGKAANGSGGGMSSGGAGPVAGAMSTAGGGRDAAGAGNTSTAGGTGGSGGAGGLAAGGRSGGAGGETSAAGSIAAGGVSTSGAGDSGTLGTAGDGQAGDPNCIDYIGTCACDWLAPACTKDTDLYVGQECPPTFADAMLIANWPLGGPPVSGMPRPTADYSECDDGSRSFDFTLCGNHQYFGFDAQGHLTGWAQLTTICGGRSCTDSSTSATRSCMTCTMTSTPSAAGTFCVSNKMNNGPSPTCMVDANGRWLAPPSCND